MRFADYDTPKRALVLESYMLLNNTPPQFLRTRAPVPGQGFLLANRRLLKSTTCIE